MAEGSKGVNLASVTFSKNELEALLGRKIKLSELENALPSMGVPVENVDGETLTVDITPNRPDLLSVEGIARAFSLFAGGKAKQYSAKDSGVKLHIDDSVLPIRPFIVGALVRNVKLDERSIESLMQLQEKLHETYGRKRRKVSIGVHNFDAVQPPFYYKAVEPESCSFVPLDMEKKITLSEILELHPKGMEYSIILEGCRKYPLLVDSRNQTLSFPPIINGELTRVSGSTRNIFIDVTGTDANAVMDALKITALALVDRGGELFTVEVVGKKKLQTPDLECQLEELPVEKINKMLGMNFSEAQLLKLLSKMGYTAAGRKLRVPCYRADVMGWVDLAEDAAIAYGYNNFEPSLPNFFSMGQEKRSEIVEGRARELMTGLDFLEVMCYNLTNEQECFGKMLLEEKPHVKIKNPKVEEFTMLRTWILPSLLKIISESKQTELPIKIFEIGDAVSLEGAHVNESRHLTCAVYDSKATFSGIKSIADALIREMGWDVDIKEAEHPSFIKGRAAELVCNKKRIGVLGEIHPQVLSNFGLEQPVALLEIDLTYFF
ncbi:phenylalanine--tRNA ligase subunit beta [Candidatus Micrarchaeota archaeon]|nr:phenylalanine--tRNA ligase subunit beta [Candidatus Micrarchaeota archaeon]